ncbi:MAG: hypothetical protein JNL30_15590 [Rubrivivax sp.]|nr:hypothetical protein [Rubrivivax sp.]
MAKHQIFLLHGMGSFEPGWSARIQQQIGELFARYPGAAAFVDDVEFKEITYDAAFEAWRTQWAQDAKGAAGALTAVGLAGGAAARLVELSGKASGDNLLRTHVLDVVAYRFLLPVAQEVWRSVQKQITGHLKSLPQGDSLHSSVIAHGLGTAVAYEAYHGMMTDGLDSVRLASAFRPDNVFLVANAVKPLWNRGGSVYPAVMAPSLSVADGWCFRMASFAHRLDPFARLERFDPPDSWFSPMAPRGEVYLDATIAAEDLQDENVHAFEHYLGHPAVHVPLLRWLSFDAGISKKEHDAALAQWRTKSLATAAKAKARTRLEAALVSASKDWAREIKMLGLLREIMLASKLKGGES